MKEFINEVLKAIAKSEPIRISAAITVSVVLLYVVHALIYVDIPDGNKEALYIVLGTVGTSFVQIVSYYFGSSSGSKQKSDMIADKLNEKK